MPTAPEYKKKQERPQELLDEMTRLLVKQSGLIKELESAIRES